MNRLNETLGAESVSRSEQSAFILRSSLCKDRTCGVYRCVKVLYSSNTQGPQFDGHNCMCGSPLFAVCPQFGGIIHVCVSPI